MIELPEGTISESEYLQKYGMKRAHLWYLRRKGRVDAVEVERFGRHKSLWAYRDAPPRSVKCIPGDGVKQCPRCRRVLPLSEYSPQSNGKPRSWCKQCCRDNAAAAQARKVGDEHVIKALEHDLAIMREREDDTPEIAAAREDRVVALAEYYESRGLTGEEDDV